MPSVVNGFVYTVQGFCYFLLLEILVSVYNEHPFDNANNANIKPRGTHCKQIVLRFSFKNAIRVLGGSWYLLTKYSCTCNCTYNHVKALKGLSVGDKYSSNWLIGTMN